MLNHNSGLFVLLVASSIALGAQDLSAQNETENSGAVLEEVIVTATRRAESLQDVGVAISNIDVENFRDIGLDSLGDIISYTPGISYVSQGQPFQGQIIMRGVTQEAGAPIVGMYVDDVPISTSIAGPTTSSFSFDWLLGDVERIEIIKGPQGTLFGANSVGGVVRYVTRDPSMDQVRGNFIVDLSNTKGAGDFNYRLQGTISFPLIKDTLGLTLSAYTNENAGYVDRVDQTSIGLAPAATEVNDSGNKGGSLIALWDITEKSSLKLMVLYAEADWTHQGTISYNHPDNGDVLEPTYGEFLTAVQDGPSDTTYDNLALSFKTDFGWAVLDWTATKVEFENENFNDLTTTMDLILGGKSSPFHPDTLDPGGVPHTFSNIFAGEYEKTSSEIRLTSSGSEKIEWLLGLFYTDEDSLNVQNIEVSPAVTGVDYFTFNLGGGYKETSGFANATYYFVPEFDISAGIRYTDTKQSNQTTIAGLFGTGSLDSSLVIPVDLSVKEDVTTYSFGARWRPRDELSLYARAASGFRPGFIPTPFGGGDPIVKSDSMWSYELGAKGRLANGLMTYDFALWSMVWEDFQVVKSVGGVAGAGNANTDITGQGFEATFNFLPVDNFNIQASISYAKSELDDDDVELGGLEGDQTRYVPKWSGSLMANYVFDAGSLDANVGGGIRYVGDFETSYSGPLSNGLVNSAFPVDSTTVVDINFGLTGQSFAARLYVTNLLNEYGLANANAVGFQGVAANAFAFPIRPRTIGINVSYFFGL